MINKLKNQKGFTIIEVLIVLAIAGLILLIVFLAVPALQRNQRNTTRNDEAARWAAATTECMANRNSTITSCDSAAEIEEGTMTQLTGYGTASTTSVLVQFGTTNGGCTADGSATAAGASARSFSVSYQIEPAIGRCITG